MIAVGFHHRFLFSLATLVLGIIPLFDRPRLSSAPYWLVSCVLVSPFPLLPADMAEDAPMLVLGALTIGTLGFASRWKRSLFHLPTSHDLGEVQTRFLYVQLGLVTSAALIVASTSASLAAGLPLPLLNQVAAWAVFLLGLASILVRVSENDLDYTVQIFLGLAPGLILLSINYEPLFYAALAVNLGLWRMLGGNSHRTSLFFLFYMFLAFFASGNIASITSFQVAGCYRFFTVFEPFAMTALLVWKLFIYFLTVTAVFTMILRRDPDSSWSTFLTTLALADVTSLVFFFQVRDSGSWLEIGVSLSHFILANGFCVFQMALFYAMKLLYSTIPAQGRAGRRGA